MQMNSSTHQKPLRLWPGVVIVALQWLAWVAVPIFVPEAGGTAILVGLACGLAVIAWWLFFSRARWADRLGVLLLAVVGLGATWFAADLSISTGAMGGLLPMLALPPLSVALLRLCDGRRTVDEITRAFRPPEDGFSGIPVDTACLFGLMQLREDGIIGLSASPLTWEEEVSTNDDARARAARYSLPPQAGNTQQPWPPLRPDEHAHRH